MTTTYEQALGIGLTLTDRARERYEAQGEIAPALSAIGRFAIVATPTLGNYETVPVLAHYLSWASRATHIVFIAEAWRKAYPVDDPAGPALRHGDLAVMAETDPDVSTAIMVDVYDVAHPNIGVSIESVPQLADDGQQMWEAFVEPGPPKGDLPDAIRHMLAQEVEWPPPSAADLEDFGNELVERGLAYAVWVQTPPESSTSP